ncbi:MAG TPA: hypothetical protein VGK19_24375 [Capsulimonadaceae bacterium]
MNCPPDAEHPLRGLDELGRRAAIAHSGLGKRLTVPMKVTGNAGLTGSTAGRCEQALNCPPDAEHPLRGLEELAAGRMVCQRARRPRGAADGTDDGDRERGADRFDGVRVRCEQAVNCPPDAEHPLRGLDELAAG